MGLSWGVSRLSAPSWLCPASDTFLFLPCFSPDCSPQTFGIPLCQVIANDRANRRLQEAVGKSRRLCLEVETSVTRFRAQRQKRSPMGRSFGLVPCGVFPEEPLSPAFPDSIARSQRRVRLRKRAAPCWVGRLRLQPSVWFPRVFSYGM